MCFRLRLQFRSEMKAAASAGKALHSFAMKTLSIMKSPWHYASVTAVLIIVLTWHFWAEDLHLSVSTFDRNKVKVSEKHLLISSVNLLYGRSGQVCFCGRTQMQFGDDKGKASSIQGCVTKRKFQTTLEKKRLKSWYALPP